MKAKHIVLVILTLFVAVGALSAQTTTTAQTETVNLATIFKDSGVFGYIIVLVFLIGIVYAVVRYVQLYHREKINAQNLYKSLKGYIKNKPCRNY